MNVYAKYQWQNYGAANENEWDGYRFKIKYFVPITDLWGGQLSYIGFTNFDWGSDLGDDSGNAINGIFFCILIHVAVAVQMHLRDVRKALLRQ